MRAGRAEEGEFLLSIILKFVATSASGQLVINITTDRRTHTCAYIYTYIYVFIVCVCASELIVKLPYPVQGDYLRFIFNASEINTRVKWEKKETT